MFPTKEQIEQLKKTYPIGSRVELVKMEDDFAPAVGIQGTVTGVDDIGSLLVKWDNGSGLHALWGVDFVRKVVAK